MLSPRKARRKRANLPVFKIHARIADVVFSIIHIPMTQPLKRGKTDEKALFKYSRLQPLSSSCPSHQYVFSDAWWNSTLVACFRPRFGWRRRFPNQNGKYPIVFDVLAGQPGSGMEIPCGSCEGCRADQAYQWAIRIYQEASLYDRNCFVTLTYDDHHLPADGKISKDELQRFWKRLRHFGKLRYFACGEYGERTKRPHYHAIIFGQDFLTPDTIQINDNLYSCPIVSETWGLGNVLISQFNMATACYVAGYVNKKIGDHDTFSVMSTRPGIGSEWLHRYIDDVARLGSLVIEGKEVPVPRRYYLWALDELEHVKEKSRERMKKKEVKRFDKFGNKEDKERRREIDAKKIHLEQRRGIVGEKEKL